MFTAPSSQTISVCSWRDGKLLPHQSSDVRWELVWKTASGVVGPSEVGPLTLLLHGVLDGPLLAGAGLQDQQVAEVNVGRHHLQTAAGGSVYDGLVLHDGRRERALCCYQVQQMLHVTVTGSDEILRPDVDRCFSLTSSGANYSVLIVKNNKSINLTNHKWHTSWAKTLATLLP